MQCLQSLTAPGSQEEAVSPELFGKKKEENGEIPSLTLELWCTSVIA